MAIHFRWYIGDLFWKLHYNRFPVNRQNMDSGSLFTSSHCCCSGCACQLIIKENDDDDAIHVTQQNDWPQQWDECTTYLKWSGRQTDQSGYPDLKFQIPSHFWLSPFDYDVIPLCGVAGITWATWHQRAGVRRVLECSTASSATAPSTSGICRTSTNNQCSALRHEAPRCSCIIRLHGKKER